MHGGDANRSIENAGLAGTAIRYCIYAMSVRLLLHEAGTRRLASALVRAVSLAA